MIFDTALFKKYVCNDDYNNVLQYLNEYNDIYPVLIKAIAAANTQFPDAILKLSRYTDIECSTDIYLALQIQMTKYPDDLFEKIDIVDREYLKELSNARSGWLT